MLNLGSMMTMTTTLKTVLVNLPTHPYQIYIGRGLLHNFALWQKMLKNRQIFIVSDENVAPHYLTEIIQQVSDYQCDYIILPAGEQFKTLDTLNTIMTELITKGHDRTTTLCALGGGVIGDMTGFAAACYRRGVDYIQMPTTLLAQVDSAIGGKTAVNHALGKNMIGAFHQANGVIIDIDTLLTLPEREFIAGLAEVIKYGLIADSDFFQWLEQHTRQIMQRDLAVLVTMIERSCQIKAHFVVKDEREQGVRALLNFGHTFGHAIETATGYTSWLHGEAVAVGMLAAADLSCRENTLSREAFSRIKALVMQFGLPIKPPADITPQRFLSLMAHDKKVLAGQLRLVLLNELGHATISSDYNIDNLYTTLEHIQEL